MTHFNTHSLSFSLSPYHQPLPLTTSFPDVQRRHEFLPSVDFGPVDISKALSTLTGWQPTPLAEAIKQTTLFFEQVLALLFSSF